MKKEQPMPIQFPPLPYESNSLEPSISKKTLEFHHGKHHKKYVEKLNELIKNSPLDEMDLLAIILESSASDQSIFNNAAQAWNHDFYWHCLTPGGHSAMGEEFKNKINESFGSLEEFKKQFEESAKKLFGSGWTWLVCDDDGKLTILNTKDADNPWVHDLNPLLTCDVWEHAYYLDYQNERGSYLKNFWNIVDWSFVEGNWTVSGSMAIPEREDQQPSQLQ
jgi:Fe-Mn family superoxide dismutase